ncbi:MAG: cytochrome b [Alphaproteobacteria bacterium]|nr:cytochrome b [Alphaproteobacteria bacterium]
MTVPYAAPLRALHWTTAGLVLALFAIGWAIDFTSAAATRKLLLTVHQSIGLLVVLLAVSRLFLRSRLGVPRPVQGLPRWMDLLSRATHAAFYLLMVALPLSGWFYTGAKGGTVRFFWLVRLPRLSPADDGWADFAFEVHELVGFALLFLIGAHVAAALYHHFVRGDETLRRMMPLSPRLS